LNEAPNDLCTNHRLLTKADVEHTYRLILGTNVVQAQISPLILRPKKYIGPDIMQVDFDIEGTREAFQTLHCTHVHDYGRGYEVRESFLNCFTWESVEDNIFDLCALIKQ
jgi:hypothetical protein